MCAQWKDFEPDDPCQYLIIMDSGGDTTDIYQEARKVIPYSHGRQMEAIGKKLGFRVLNVGSGGRVPQDWGEDPKWTGIVQKYAIVPFKAEKEE